MNFHVTDISLVKKKFFVRLGGDSRSVDSRGLGLGQGHLAVGTSPFPILQRVPTFCNTTRDKIPVIVLYFLLLSHPV